MLLIGNGRLVTRDPENPYVDDGAVLIDGGTIRDVGTATALRARYKDADFEDARGGLIMPGLINAHDHAYSALARGMSVAGYHRAALRIF
jgi:cytosine/adenosine deaminase-related metal-dependent hydrolase